MQFSIQCNSENYVIEPGHILTIGRSIKSDIRLFEDTSVHRTHCVISLQDDTLIIEDQANVNGDPDYKYQTASLGKALTLACLAATLRCRMQRIL